jgi:hypothetical protein
VLNLADVPYIDCAGSVNRSDLHHGEPAGRQPQAPEPDQADHRPARHTKLLTVFETYDNEADAVRSFSSANV